MPPQLRVLMSEGPGDALAAFERWKKGLAAEKVTHEPFSTQLFDVCQELGAAAKLIAFHPNQGYDRHGDFEVESWGQPFAGKRGVAYHLANAALAARLAAEASRYRADVLFIGNEPNAFLFSPLVRLGVPVVPVYHCTLWPRFEGPKRVQRLFSHLDGRFARRRATSVMAVSNAIFDQVEQVAGTSVPAVGFLPSFPASDLQALPAPRWPGPDAPFELLYAGRVEREKGILDLLDALGWLQSRGAPVRLTVCGSGGADRELEQQVKERGLEEHVRRLGWCTRAQMMAAFGESHAVVVPTRTSFEEGFNMVVAEAILAGRPVVTSAVCPSAAYTGGAAVEVEPNDPLAYAEVIARWIESEAAFSDQLVLVRAAAERFQDPSFNYRAALRHVLEHVGRGAAVPARPFPRLAVSP